MPTYTYACVRCGFSFDVFHAMSAAPKVRCEACNSTRCEKQLGIGSGIIFKGSGFYETDFKDKKGKKDSNGGPAKAKSGATDSKPAADSKPAPASTPASSTASS